MYKWIVIVLLAFPVIVFSQQKRNDAKPYFQTSAGAAFLAGQAEPSWQGQVSSGLSINKWFAGIGTGFDEYRFSTVPVFATARRNNLFKTSLFAYADAGIALPWKRNEPIGERFFNERHKLFTGFYSETGIGYQFPSQNRFAFRLSAGYSFRTMKQHITRTMWWSSAWPTPDDIINRHHRFHLLTLRTAVSFNHRK